MWVFKLDANLAKDLTGSNSTYSTTQQLSSDKFGIAPQGLIRLWWINPKLGEHHSKGVFHFRPVERRAELASIRRVGVSLTCGQFSICPSDYTFGTCASKQAHSQDSEGFFIEHIIVLWSTAPFPACRCRG